MPSCSAARVFLRAENTGAAMLVFWTLDNSFNIELALMSPETNNHNFLVENQQNKARRARFSEKVMWKSFDSNKKLFFILYTIYFSSQAWSDCVRSRDVLICKTIRFRKYQVLPEFYAKIYGKMTEFRFTKNAIF